MAELLEAYEVAAPAIHDHADFLTRVDVLQALCRWADRSDGRLVELGPGRLHLKEARHPLIDPRLAALREEALGSPSLGDKVVPLNLDTSTKRIAFWWSPGPTPAARLWF